MTTTRHAYDTATTIQIVAKWCPGCGIAYGLPEGYAEQRRKDHKSWTCPNGCSLSFPKGPSDAERLRRQLERAEAARERANVRANGEEARRRLAERQRAAAKGQVTKIKNRVAKGVCPCCNRTFENLARHMAGQHPDYSSQEK